MQRFGSAMIPSLDIEGQYRGNERAYTCAMGIYLIIWCFFTVLFLIAALKTNLTITILFFVLVFSFLLLAIANFIASEHPTQSARVNKAGGALTVICAAVAFYAGPSGLMVSEATWVRFPLGEIPVQSA